MPVARTAAKKALYRRIGALSDSNAARVMEFIDDIEGHEPNEETVKAIEESMNPETLTDCDDIDDMFRKCGVEC